MSNPYKFWEFQGKTYRSWRDHAGYIYISELKSGDKHDPDAMWYTVGNAGYDFCFRFQDVPKLAKKLGVPVQKEIPVDKRIGWYVWKPSRGDRALGLTVDVKSCRYGVHDDFGVGFHQCSRKGKVEIKGFKFCAQHSKIVWKGLAGGGR